MKHTTLGLVMKDKETRYHSKNLLRFKNGYILEFNHNKPGSWQEEKNIFSVFFNEFNDYYVVQKLRDYLLIRRDKWREGTKTPYIKEIFHKSVSKEEIFERCFKDLETLVEKDNIAEKSFDRKENGVDKFVQDYFHEELHAHLSEPLFNEWINGRIVK